MHHCCLLTPAARELWGNMGHRMMVAGIRWLIRQAEPEVTFHELDLMRYDAELWNWTAQHADSLVICGVPRLGPMLDSYRGKGFWQDVLAIRSAGVPVADVSPGTHFLLEPTLDAYVARALDNPENRYVMECEGQMNLVLPRDAVFVAVAKACGIACTLMPCASYWAARASGISAGKRRLDAWSIRADMGVTPWALTEIDRHQRIMAEQRRTLVVVQTISDFAAAEQAGIEDLILVTDSLDFLRLMGQVDTLISLRVHSTIPSLALGVRVLNIRLDSRAMAVDEFGVQSHPIEILREPSLPLDLAQTGPNATVMGRHRESFIALWKETMHR